MEPQTIIHSAILQPVVALAGWTMVMWVWLFARRIPALRAARLDIANKIGGTGKDLDGVLPEKVQWPAHNYNHLHEAPTVFYAVALVLALVGWGNGLNAGIAWAYVVLRVLHSLVQVTFNKVGVRFLLYALSSLCLIALTLHAAMAVFVHG